MNAVVPFLEASAVSDPGLLRLPRAEDISRETPTQQETSTAAWHGGKTNRQQALKLSSGKQQTIALLLVDPVMPGIGGREVAQKLRSSCPGLRVVYTSGYEQAARANDSEPILLFRKPFTRGALLQKVHEALDSVPGPTFKTGSPS